MGRCKKLLDGPIPVVIVPKSAVASLRVCEETQRMVNDLAKACSDRAGYRVSANSVVNLLAQKALQDLGVS
jgi:hypothetical protein